VAHAAFAEQADQASGTDRSPAPSAAAGTFAAARAMVRSSSCRSAVLAASSDCVPLAAILRFGAVSAGFMAAAA
jgi:hypothetical protein